MSTDYVQVLVDTTEKFIEFLQERMTMDDNTEQIGKVIRCCENACRYTDNTAILIMEEISLGVDYFRGFSIYSTALLDTIKNSPRYSPAYIRFIDDVLSKTDHHDSILLSFL